MTPLGNWLWCQMMLAPQVRASGLELLERPKASDAVVLNLPEGRLCATGARHPVDVEQGDRVIASPFHFRHWKDGECFLRIDDVVAVLPGPEHRAVRPAGPYVLVEPELIPRVHERESGVLVSHVRLRGGTSRDLERGERLYREFHARGTALKRAGLCEGERQEVLAKEVRDLPVVDREALKAALADEGDTGYKTMRPPSSAKEPRCGAVYAVGPGAVREDGTRMAPVGIIVGSRVFWERDTAAVELWDGHRILFAVDWRRVCAEEVAADDAA